MFKAKNNTQPKSNHKTVRAYPQQRPHRRHNPQVTHKQTQQAPNPQHLSVPQRLPTASQDLSRITVVSQAATLRSTHTRHSTYNFTLVTGLSNVTAHQLITRTLSTLSQVARHNTINTSNHSKSNYNVLTTVPRSFFHTHTHRTNFRPTTHFTINGIFLPRSPTLTAHYHRHLTTRLTTTNLTITN